MFDFIYNVPSFISGVLVGFGITIVMMKSKLAAEVQSAIETLDTQLRVALVFRARLEQERNLNEGLIQELAAQAKLVK